MPDSLIVTDPLITFGRPTIAGTQVTVDAILEQLAQGQTPAQIQARWPELPPHAIGAALQFTADLLRNQTIPLEVLGPQPVRLKAQPTLTVRAYVPEAESVRVVRLEAPTGPEVIPGAAYIPARPREALTPEAATLIEVAATAPGVGAVLEATAEVEAALTASSHNPLFGPPPLPVRPPTPPEAFIAPETPESWLPPLPAAPVPEFPPSAPALMSRPMARIHPDGIFEVVWPGENEAFAYQLEVHQADGQTYLVEDPYRFPPRLTENDLYLLTADGAYDTYHKLGAHVIDHQGVHGVWFVVWAPNAERVNVVGDFNHWDNRRHPMRPHGHSGLWELFVPGLGEGTVYNYDIKSRYGWVPMRKIDPYAFATELRPNFGSVVWDLGHYQWGDAQWLAERGQRQALSAPLAIYEVHLGSWRRGPDLGAGPRWLTYRELADTLIPYVKALGFTHLELMPVAEHPFDGSWGYQVVNYFAPTSRFGTPDDFRYFIDQTHQAGLGVIMDWVPAHYPTDAHGLAFFDGAPLYEHADRRKSYHPDWNTLIFNFERPEVCAFLLANARFWVEQYHIDGLRVDAVSSMLYLDYSRKAGDWLPNHLGGRENLEAMQFLQKFNALLHTHFPDVLTIAEESTTWAAISDRTRKEGLGFDYKWNMGWMHDMLEYMQTDPLFRGGRHNDLTFSLTYAFSENFLLAFSHDEVVHGKRSLLNKMPGDVRQKFASLRALYAFMYAHPGKKLLFMGAEIAQLKEWNHDTQLEWGLLSQEGHRNLQLFMRDLNHFYRATSALHTVDFGWEGFQWIDVTDAAHSVVSFVRRSAALPQLPTAREILVVVANFTPVPRPNYRVGLPEAGHYREVFNTDAYLYGGGSPESAELIEAEPRPWQSQPASALLHLPPLSVIFLQPTAL